MTGWDICAPQVEYGKHNISHVLKGPYLWEKRTAECHLYDNPLTVLGRKVQKCSGDAGGPGKMGKSVGTHVSYTKEVLKIPAYHR